MLGCRVIFSEKQTNDTTEQVGVIVSTRLKETTRKAKQGNVTIIIEVGRMRGAQVSARVGDITHIEEPNINELLTHSDERVRRIGRRLLVEQQRHNQNAGKSKSTIKLPS